ncbi:hypothetical protein B0T39_22490 [Chromobacterium haemolyticum]|nr:hypothetical protein B0T39_22490 [Chromobacterium haemolyticum]
MSAVLQRCIADAQQIVNRFLGSAGGRREPPASAVFVATGVMVQCSRVATNNGYERMGIK